MGTVQEMVRRGNWMLNAMFVVFCDVESLKFEVVAFPIVCKYLVINEFIVTTAWNNFVGRAICPHTSQRIYQEEQHTSMLVYLFIVIVVFGVNGASVINLNDSTNSTSADLLVSFRNVSESYLGLIRERLFATSNTSIDGSSATLDAQSAEVQEFLQQVEREMPSINQLLEISVIVHNPFKDRAGAGGMDVTIEVDSGAMGFYLNVGQVSALNLTKVASYETELSDGSFLRGSRHVATLEFPTSTGQSATVCAVSNIRHNILPRKLLKRMGLCQCFDDLRRCK